MDLSFLKKALLDPGIYPDNPREIRWVETHISLVFLTGKHAYKIKKPVDFGFLDFTSLEKRKFFCEQEVNLNRRLAPDIYLGVLKITERDGKVSFDGDGKVIEYAVKMEQLPEELLMNHLVQENRVTPPMMEAIAGKLVHHYQPAEIGAEYVGVGQVRNFLCPHFPDRPIVFRCVFRKLQITFVTCKLI